MLWDIIADFWVDCLPEVFCFFDWLFMEFWFLMLLFGVLTILLCSSSSLLSFVRMFSSIRKSTPPENWSMEISSCLLDWSWRFFVFNPVRMFFVLIPVPPVWSSSYLSSLTLSTFELFCTFLNSFSSIFMSLSYSVWLGSSLGPSSEMPSSISVCLPLSARLLCFFWVFYWTDWLLKDFSVYSLKLFSWLMNGLVTAFKGVIW